MRQDLPRRPKLRGYLRNVELDADRLLIHGGDRSVLLTGASVREVVPSLLPLLTGDRTLAEILVSDSEIEPAVMEDALVLMQENGLLEDAAIEPLPQLDLPALSRQTTFWLSVTDDRYAAQERLADACVTIFGLGAVGSAVARVLAETGVGRLRLVDDARVSPADSQFSSSDRQVGERRSVATQTLLEELGLPVATEVYATDASESGSEGVSGARIAVVCSETDSPKLYERVNDACLAHRVPWLRAAIDHGRGAVGPLVIPYETACYVCLILRLRANLAFAADALAYEEHIRLHGPTAEVAVLAPFAGLVANIAALDAVKLITAAGRPLTEGAFAAVDFISGEVRRHEVIKLPRCPACGRTTWRPRMKIWDIKPLADGTADEL